MKTARTGEEAAEASQVGEGGSSQNAGMLIKRTLMKNSQHVDKLLNFACIPILQTSLAIELVPCIDKLCLHF